MNAERLGVHTSQLNWTSNADFSPGIQYEDLAYTAQNGFATVGTNNGHNGTGGVAFYQNPDIIEDFAYRA